MAQCRGRPGAGVEEELSVCSFSSAVGDLRDFVRSHLGNPELSFYLCKFFLLSPLLPPVLETLVLWAHRPSQLGLSAASPWEQHLWPPAQLPPAAYGVCVGT